jgi:hypothetical protein
LVPHALQLSFKTHQDHVKIIVDTLVEIIVQHPDDTVALSPEISIASPFIGNLAILAVGRTV